MVKSLTCFLILNGTGPFFFFKAAFGFMQNVLKKNTVCIHLGKRNLEQLRGGKKIH